jgi:hypothetical protein
VRALVASHLGPGGPHAMTDRTGSRYTLFAWSKDPVPSGELFAWSGDKQRALFGHFPSGRQDNFGPTDELNLRTGKITRIPIDPSSLVVGYTRPHGGQLLVEAGLKPETGDGTFELVDLQGKVTRKLWSGYIYQPLFSSPDGKTYVVEDADGQALVSANGQVLRRIGHKDASCAPLRWWDAATVLAACVPLGPGDGNSQIWLIPASGKAPTAQTPLRTQGGASADWGDYDYVRLASGDYVEAMGPHCGDHVIARLGPHGKATVIKVPGATDIKIEAATATRLLLTQAGDCGTGVSSQSLVWLDPKTGAETPAVSAQKGQFGVLGVVPYDDMGPH